MDNDLLIIQEDLEYGTYKVYEADNLSAYVVINNEELCYYGANTKRYSRDSETLFEFNLSKEETKKLISALRLEQGAKEMLGTILKNEFGSGDAMKFIGFCRKHGIVYSE